MNNDFILVDELINLPGLSTLVFWSLLNFAFAFVVIRGIYAKSSSNREYMFSFFMINTLVFFVTALLSTAKLKTGFAFGMFAVFAILRYRTEAIPIREMTFFFICIILAVTNAVAFKEMSLIEILYADVAITGITWVLEVTLLRGFEKFRMINYERIELIHPDRQFDLHRDIEDRTGLKVRSVAIERVNFLNDTARLRVYYE